MTMSKLMAIIHKYAESDPMKDDSGEDDNGKSSKSKGGKGGSRSTTKQKSEGGSELVTATTDGRGFKNRRGNYPRKKLSAQEILAQPCRFHSSPDKSTAHTTDECSWTKDIIKAKAVGNQGGDRDKPDVEKPGPGMPPTSGAFHTFVGFDSKSEKKVVKHTVHA